MPTGLPPTAVQAVFCTSHIGDVEALDAEFQSPLKRGNICAGSKGRLEVGQGKEGLCGEGKKKVQSIENSGYSKCSGADLLLKEGVGVGGWATERRLGVRWGFLKPELYPLVGNRESIEV